MDSPNACVLIAEDEPMVAGVVARYLTRDGFRVHHASDGEQAMQLAEQHSPDLVILDLMLPKLDGFEVFRRLRAIGPVPVIIVTAKGEETDRIVGLELGADDYVTKPFSPRELAARVRAVLRRTTQNGVTEGLTIRSGSFTIDPARRTLSIAGRSIELTAKEFDLILFLVRHTGQVFTRDQLLDRVWDYHYYGDASTVTVHVHRLRNKIESDPLRPRYLRTVWGVGYKFET
ncbi:MAG: response regulator transcription factor [Thermomicrobiaceae bacterium]